MHAEGFAAGELKHGPIALIDDGLPVIVVMPSPKSASTLHAKLLSNIREIQARAATTIVIAEEADDTVRPYADHLIEIRAVPMLFQPLLSTIPLQVFAASVAQAKATTSTNRATWPSPSPSNNAQMARSARWRHSRSAHARRCRDAMGVELSPA
jgi:glucosamine 6-phosphate synthetase-like amidotransferase/phosphosugar isomerase protein